MSENEQVVAKFEAFKQYDYSESDVDKIMGLEEKIKEKMADDALAKYKETVCLLYRMLKDSFSGKYYEVPRKTVSVIVGTLLYLNAPVDVIPDFIPKAGYSDDAEILDLCRKYVAKDIDRYKIFVHLNREINCSH